MKTIGVVTTGGDAPGINAAIRAVVRIAYTESLQVLGFERGWEGLLTNAFKRLAPRSVGGIIQLGGTILLTSRCSKFRKKEGIEKAAETLALNNVDGLVVTKVFWKATKKSMLSAFMMDQRLIACS